MEMLNSSLKKYGEKILKNSKLKWKKTGFTILPNSLVEDTRLDIYCLVIFWIIKLHSMNKKQCFPSIQTICDKARCSKPVAIDRLKKLQKYGYIEIKKNGRKNIYYLK